MRHTRKQKEEKLLADARSLIGEFLDWEEQVDKPNLTQIEDIVLVLRERLGQRMAEVAIDDQELSSRSRCRSVRPVASRCATRGKKGRMSRVASAN